MFSVRIKEMIGRCWNERLMELWLFGVNGEMSECNVGLLNVCLSHARHAVKLRRNIAHYEGRMEEVWDIMERTTKRDIGLLFQEKEVCVEDFVEGCSLIEVNDGKLRFNFEIC